MSLSVPLPLLSLQILIPLLHQAHVQSPDLNIPVQTRGHAVSGVQILIGKPANSKSQAKLRLRANPALKVKLLCGYTMHFYEKYYEFEKHENCKSILFTVEFHLRKSICVLFRQV